VYRHYLVCIKNIIFHFVFRVNRSAAGHNSEFDIPTNVSHVVKDRQVLVQPTVNNRSVAFEVAMKFLDKMMVLTYPLLTVSAPQEIRRFYYFVA